jgi:hypothetical protein
VKAERDIAIHWSEIIHSLGELRTADVSHLNTQNPWKIHYVSGNYVTSTEIYVLKYRLMWFGEYVCVYAPELTIYVTFTFTLKKTKTTWSESAKKLYRPNDHSLSAKWLPTFADRGCHVVSMTYPYGRIVFSRQEPLLFYQVAPQLYSRGWVHPVSDPLLFFLVVPGIEPGPPDL